MKSNAKTLLKVLVATAILCLFTAIGASAEVKTGTFTDANVASDNTYTPGNTYTYKFDTESGALEIDAEKDSAGNYTHNGLMTLDTPEGTDAIVKAYIPWYDNTFDDGTKFAKESVKSVTIGPGIHKLGRRLLSRTAITNLTVPGTVTAGSEWGAATDCPELQAVTFEDGVTSIGSKFAYNCPKLKDVYLSRTVSYIHPQAFGGDSEDKGGTATIHHYPLTTPLKALKSVKTTTNANFINQNKNLKYESVNNIYAGEFKDYKNDVFTYSFDADFDDRTYDWNTLPVVTRTLTVDAKKPLAENETNLTIDSTLPQYMDKNDGNKNIKNDYPYPWMAKAGNWIAEINAVEFGSNLINIGREMCEDMVNLTSVTVPGNIRSVDWGTFKSCSNLKTAVFEEGFREFSGGRNFQYCTNLTDLYIPLSTENLNANMLGTNGDGPKSVKLHYWFEGSGNAAVSKYSSLSNVVPTKRTGTLTLLTKDTDGTADAIKIEITPETAVMSISANSDETGNRIGNGRIRTYNSVWSAVDSKTKETIYYEVAPYAGAQIFVKEVIIGDGIEYVPSSLIINGKQMSKITFGSSVKEIGSFAVNGSTALTTVELAEGITTLRPGIFNNCTKLTNVTIPKSATSVGTILRHTNTYNQAPDNVVVTAYKGTAGETMLFGRNADRVEKLTAANQEYRRNEAKIINDDGSVAYVLLNPNSTSTLATEAAENGYKTVTFGVPVVKIADDKTSADAAFTGAAAKGILIATKHDANGNMTAVQLDGVTAKSAGYYTVDFDDTFKAAEGTVTAMLWDGIDTMKPLCASVSK